MEVLFSLGALIIGIRVRYWLAAGIAAVHLTAVTLAIIFIVAKRESLALPSSVLYIAAVIAGIVIYLRGLRLSRDHARRETCELLGAVGVIGALATIVVVATTLVRR